MNITKEEVLEFVELMKEAESLRPIVQTIIDTIKSFGPELSDIPEKVLQWNREQRVKAVEFYKSKGFSHDDAILMTLDDIYATRQIKNKIPSRSKDKS